MPLEPSPFLPAWPFTLNGPLLFGLLLLAGLAGGALAARTRVLPALSGYLAVGWLLGPGGAGLLDASLLEEARLFVDISLGLVLFELGRRLDFQWLVHDRWLLVTGVAESALSFTLMFLALRAFAVPALSAGMVAAIGVAVSPAVVMLVAHELGAEGPVTRRLLALTALNNVFALVVFTALLPLVHLSFAADWLTVLLHPLYRLAGSLALGSLAAGLALWGARCVGKREAGQFILLVGLIVAAVGAARALNLSVMLTLLAFGILAKNLDRRRALMEVEFGYGGQLFFVVLFVGVGASLDFHGEVALLAVLAFVGARFLGKLAAVLILGRASGLAWRQSALLGTALTPMAGVALGMTQAVTGLYPAFGAQVAALVASSVALLNVAGPVLTRLALARAGEADPEKTR